MVTELKKSRSNITEALTTVLLPIQTALEAVKSQVELVEAHFELQSTVQDLAKENEGLTDTLDGHENRQRRMNLRVLGVASGESAEQ